eukprot:scaffold8754_cov24-Prasinocladus_malaysianus.AAC.1
MALHGGLKTLLKGDPFYTSSPGVDANHCQTQRLNTSMAFLHAQLSTVVMLCQSGIWHVNAATSLAGIKNQKHPSLASQAGALSTFRPCC